MATKAKTKVKAKAKTAVKAKPKPKPKAKPMPKAKAKPKTKPKAKVVPKSKPKAAPKAKKAVAKAKPVAKKVIVKAKAAPKAKAKPKAVLPKPKAKPAPKPQTMIKPKPKAAPIKVAPKPKAKMEVQKTNYRPNVGSGGPVDFVPYREVKNEEYMNAEQADHFRQILRNWLVQLREEVDNTMVHMQEEMGTYPDPVDRAAQEEEFSLELKARDRERKLIKKIEQAIDDIDNNDYGYCKDCGAEIGIRRLEARPTADKCIDCKTFEEIKEKQTGT